MISGEKAEILTRLRRHIARIEGDSSRLAPVDPWLPSASDDGAASAGMPGRDAVVTAPVPLPAEGVVTLGVAEIDRRLPEGGLALGRLHEVIGAVEGAGTGFIVHLLRRLLAQDRYRTRGSPVLWCAPGCSLYAPGLAGRGLDVDRLVMVTASRREDRLWAMEECLRISGVPAVVGELRARETVDLTASRRLQLAAGQGGGLALLLRPPPPRARTAGGADGAAQDEEEERLVLGASAAVTRWHVRARAGGPELLDRDFRDLGQRSLWRLGLVRSRTGARHCWTVEVDHATGDLALAAPLRDRPGASDRAIA